MIIPCAVIKDLLPLYHDGICARESTELVEAHLAQCEQCRTTLSAMDLEVEFTPQAEQDKMALKALRKKWKKSKRAALVSGIAIALAVILILFAQVSIHWYRNYAMFYIQLGEQMGVDANYPHEYGLTTPGQANTAPPKYLFPKEYFLGTAEYQFWLRTPTFLDPRGSMIVEPTHSSGDILDSEGNVLSHSADIRLAVHFSGEKTPEYYVTLEADTEHIDEVLILDGNSQLIHTENWSGAELARYQEILTTHLQEISHIIQAAQEIWNLN